MAYALGLGGVWLSKEEKILYINNTFFG